MYHMSEFAADNLRNERMLFLKQLAALPDRDAYELCDTLSIPRAKVMTFLRTYFKTHAQFADESGKIPRQNYQDVRNDIGAGVNTEFGELSDKEIDNLHYVYDEYRKKDPSLYFEADQVKANRVYNQPQVAHDSSSIPNLNQNNQPREQQPQRSLNEQLEQPNRSTDYYNRPPKPATVNDPAQSEFNVDRLNKGYSYDFLYSLTRIGLIRFVLEGLPYPPNGSKIEGFIQFFELNQDELMASPDALRDRLQRYFGDKTGEQASVAINSYIRYLKPQEKFGVRKLGGQLRDGYFLGDDPMYTRNPQQDYTSIYGGSNVGSGPIPMQNNNGVWGPGATPQQQRGGPQWQDPFNTFYHAELVLPFGMDARSPDAARLIHEWEAKKKRKREQDEAQAEILSKINQKMSFAMADVLNQGRMSPNGQSQSAFGPEFLQSLVMMSMIGMVTSGKASMIPYTDENGNVRMKLEQQPVGDHSVMPDPNQIGPKDILQLLGGMYEKIAEKSSEAMQARIDGLREMMGMNGEKKDPITQVGETVKALRETIPGFDRQFTGAGMGDPVDMAKLDLERQKFMYDKERSDKLIDQAWEIKKMEREHEMDVDLEANKTRKETIKGLTNMLKTALPSVIQVVMMFLSMRNPNMAPLAGMMGNAGGGGGLGDMIGKLMGGMFGGGKDDDEEGEDDEDDGSSITSFLNKKSGDGDEDDSGGGFNLGDIVSQVMPSVMGMMGGNMRQQQQQPQDEYEEPPRRRRKNTMRYEQGGGVRPSFMDVEVGNPQATPVQPFTAVDGDIPPDNIYENIQSEQGPAEDQDEGPELVGTSELMQDAQQKVVTDADDPNVIKLPRYQEKLIPHEDGVVIPSPRQTQPQVVDTYPDEGEGDDEQQEGDPYQIYTPEDFSAMPDEEKREAFNEGMAALKSAESYVNSISSSMKKDSLKKKRK